MHSLSDQDILVSLDEIGLEAADKAWLDGFYPAFMANSRAEGKVWSVPFQRSTAIFYYNKAAFEDAGLDPDKFPRTWADLDVAAAKLTRRDASGTVTRWGIKMASDLGNAQWTFGAMANQAERKASLRFARWVTAPERAAAWSMKTGYIATSPAAYATATLTDYVARFPVANVARSYLPVATGELSTHENQRVYKSLTDNVQACLTGQKSPEQAMADTQTEADRILRPFRRG